MKPLCWVLSASLAANAALVALALRRPGTSVSQAEIQATASSATNRANPLSGKPGLPRESAAVIEALNQGNPENLLITLRAAGLSDELVRSLVEMSIWKKYETRFQALNPQSPGPDTDKPWWKENRNPYADPFQRRLTQTQREESRRLQRAVREETEHLLGVDPGQTRWQNRELAFLPPEKRKVFQEIQQDYQDLIGEINQEIGDFRLASDTERLRYLEAEQKRDLEALLTPEERRAYELRMSETARQMRWKMTQYDATEAEYLAIFPLQKAFDEKYNLQQNDPFSEPAERDQKYWEERQEAEQQLQEKIRSLIGETRYAESNRLQDRDWRLLEAATRRLSLPADTPARLYALRDTTAEAARQIAENPALATDQKKQALASLAASTRDQIRSTLGSEGAEAYFKNNGMRWLKEIEKGNIVKFSTEDGSWSTKSLPKEPKKLSRPTPTSPLAPIPDWLFQARIHKLNIY